MGVPSYPMLGDRATNTQVLLSRLLTILTLMKSISPLLRTTSTNIAIMRRIPVRIIQFPTSRTPILQSNAYVSGTHSTGDERVAT